MADIFCQLNRADEFSSAMKEELAANAYRGDWRDCKDFTSVVAILRAEEELAELRGAILAGADPQVVLESAADVANYVFFASDLYSVGKAGCGDPSSRP